MKARLVPILATLGLAACIPRGGEDYRIGRNEAPDDAIVATSGPQIVPEQTIIADTPSWSPAVVERNAQLVEPQEYLVLNPDQSVDCRDRRERLRQVFAGLRYSLRRRAAPLRGIVIGVRASVP